MKYLALLMLLPLASCSLWEPMTQLIADPAVQAKAKETGNAVMSQDYVGAIWGVAGTISAIITALGAKKVHDKVKASGPGSFGLLAPKAE
jgi:hypothetical protein